MRKLIVFGAAILLMAGVSFGQTVDAVVSWTAPTEGSPVVRYVVQLSEDGGPFYTVSDNVVTTELTVQLDNLVTYVARVAGVDALDRQGVWSVPSDPYMPDLGVPGEPAKPIIMEQ